MRNIAAGPDGRAPKEYEVSILDEGGRIVQATVFNRKILRVGAFEVTGNKSIDLQNPAIDISIPVAETFRLIMEVANLVCSSNALDAHANEALTAIEVIARHTIASQDTA